MSFYLSVWFFSVCLLPRSYGQCFLVGIENNYAMLINILIIPLTLTIISIKSVHKRAQERWSDADRQTTKIIRQNDKEVKR